MMNQSHLGRWWQRRLHLEAVSMKSLCQIYMDICIVHSSLPFVLDWGLPETEALASLVM